MQNNLNISGFTQSFNAYYLHGAGYFQFFIYPGYFTSIRHKIINIPKLKGLSQLFH